jgi:hypothetical protein
MFRRRGVSTSTPTVFLRATIRPLRAFRRRNVTRGTPTVFLRAAIRPLRVFRRRFARSRSEPDEWQRRDREYQRPEACGSHGTCPSRVTSWANRNFLGARECVCKVWRLTQKDQADPPSTPMCPCTANRRGARLTLPQKGAPQYDKTMIESAHGRLLPLGAAGVRARPRRARPCSSCR